MQSFQHFLAYFADGSWFVVNLFVDFVDDLVELGADILSEVVDGAGGGFLGEEVKVWAIDVGYFELPEELVLLKVELKLAHFKSHFGVY